MNGRTDQQKIEICPRGAHAPKNQLNLLQTKINMYVTKVYGKFFVRHGLTESNDY